MEDHEIVALFWDRDGTAVAAASERYGAYCTVVAKNILGSERDAEECVNDTWLAAWNAIPPHRPARLAVFLGKLTRNAALNRRKQENADKRGGGELPSVLDELAECVSGADDVEGVLDRKELAAAIDAFLDCLPAEKRNIFLRRYWYADSVTVIAARYGRTPGSVSVLLNRLRKQLKAYLTERGFDL